MNAKSELVAATGSFTRREERDLPAVQANPMSILAVAVQKGMDLETIKELRALQKEWEADEARKAFNNAFAEFKATAVQVIKNRTVDDGPLSGKKYAELFAVVNAITPALSRHGLSAAWKITKDDKDWIEVTCILKHVLGHFESVSMGGPPDTGGAKSPIQSRASTVSYLERYTLKAICGVSEQGDDTDGGDVKRTPKDKGPQPYPADKFTTNLPTWRRLIESGKKSAEQIIATVSSKGTLTEEQKVQIIGKPQVDTETGETSSLLDDVKRICAAALAMRDRDTAFTRLDDARVLLPEMLPENKALAIKEIDAANEAIKARANQ